VKIIFKEHSGTVHEVEANDGETLMDAAMNNMVPGIDGDCGGDCACGTCHVFIAPEFIDKLASTISEEDDLINMTPDKEENSRLACQIKLNSELDGMEVTLPEFQM